ncbi:hypothetical protein PS928_01921 [Pseudomonas fluorescens]|uniref:Uncharacterized protein n=1 Tax=Pseudomonas fluorescens TaxID=294 RepID=A0A5E7T6Z0_PSEFL|nr:hypothetical protein PS928_01921 [Pseudomonas fluorescens]
MQMLNAPASSLASQLLQGSAVPAPRVNTANPCRSWLASESGVSGEADVECTGLFAGKPAPTRIVVAYDAGDCVAESE